MRKSKKDDYNLFLLEALGKKLRTYRKKTGMTQEQLAAESNVDRHTISNIENGKEDPGYATLYQILKALRMPADTLFYHDSSNEKDKALGMVQADLHPLDAAEIRMYHRIFKLISDIKQKPDPSKS